MFRETLSSIANQTNNHIPKNVKNWYEKIFIPFDDTLKKIHPINGDESQWVSVEDKDLPVGVVEVYNSWNKGE